MKLVSTIAAAATAAILLGGWAPTPSAVASAEAGKVWLDVRADPNSSAQRGRAVVDIDAPPSVVWKLMTDCAAIRRIMPSNRGCKVVSRKGNSEVVEQIINTPIMPDLRTVFRQDFEHQKRIVITRVDGDLKVINGEWRLDALPGGRSRVSQEMRMQPGFPAPGFMAFGRTWNIPRRLSRYPCTKVNLPSKGSACGAMKNTPPVRRPFPTETTETGPLYEPPSHSTCASQRGPSMIACTAATK